MGEFPVSQTSRMWLEVDFVAVFGVVIAAQFGDSFHVVHFKRGLMKSVGTQLSSDNFARGARSKGTNTRTLTAREHAAQSHGFTHHYGRYFIHVLLIIIMIIIIIIVIKRSLELGTASPAS